MWWGLIGALVAAVAYGAATVLQAVGVSRMTGAPAGSGLIARARAGWLYGVGLGLDGLGFLASIAALRTLPLFLVESVVASSVAVTAVLSVLFLNVRLAPREWAALAVVGIGLVLLAVSALEGPARHVHRHAGRWTLLAGILAVGLALAGWWIGRSGAPAGRTRDSAILLAVASGLGFGMVGVAARILIVADPWWQTLRHPALWAIVIHGLVSITAYGFALDRGRVTTVAAVTFATETVVPALIGLKFLGDGVRPHFGMLAIAGFVLTLGACIALASRSEPPASTSP